MARFASEKSPLMCEIVSRDSSEALGMTVKIKKYVRQNRHRETHRQRN